MKILWFTWRDKKNPLAGGAETVNERLAEHLAKDGHEVIFLVAGFNGGAREEEIGGYKVIRLGNKFTVYWRAYKYYKKNLGNWANLIIDEVNTVPFFCKFYVKEKNLLFVYQLCRKIWFYQTIFPLNLIGYLLEPLCLWLLSDKKAIVVSESTKKDLIKYGFKDGNVFVIKPGIELLPVEDLNKTKKYEGPVVLCFGNIRPMKRTGHIIKAFEIVKREIKDLKLMVAGRAADRYGKKVLKMISQLPFSNSVQYFGEVGFEEKIKLMQKSHILCVASVKEGWGLVVSEANSQGTPAIVYNVDGLIDSVKDGKTGIVCRVNNPESLAKEVIGLLKDKEKYENMRKNAWDFSKEINFEKSYQNFVKATGLIQNEQ